MDERKGTSTSGCGGSRLYFINKQVTPEGRDKRHERRALQLPVWKWRDKKTSDLGWESACHEDRRT